jgi:hypothetical protein
MEMQVSEPEVKISKRGRNVTILKGDTRIRIGYYEFLRVYPNAYRAMLEYLTQLLYVLGLTGVSCERALNVVSEVRKRLESE